MQRGRGAARGAARRAIREIYGVGGKRGAMANVVPCVR